MATVVALSAMVLLWISAATAGDVRTSRTIDLDRPGSLEQLQQSNPTHYEKARKIIDGVIEQPDTQVPRWVQVNFGGRDVRYAPIVLTSHPPKKRLSFVLEDTRYQVVVVLTNIGGEIIPAR
jgi:hypothetical protein